MSYLTKNWYYVSAVKLLTDKDPDSIKIIQNGVRKEALAEFNTSEGLPNPSDLRIVWEGTEISAPLLDNPDEMSFERTYIPSKNNMLKLLDGE